MQTYSRNFLSSHVVSFSPFQFQFKQNQRKQEHKNKMDSNDDSRLATHTDDECRLIPKSGKKTRVVADKEQGVQVSLVNCINTLNSTTY